MKKLVLTFALLVVSMSSFAVEQKFETCGPIISYLPEEGAIEFGAPKYFYKVDVKPEDSMSASLTTALAMNLKVCLGDSNLNGYKILKIMK